MRFILPWLVLVLSGCVPAPFSRHLNDRTDPQLRECARLFQEVDGAVQRAGVRDGGEARIKGYPYLRATRFLASFKDEAATEPRFSQWIDALRQTDLNARRYEVLNVAALGGASQVLERLDKCGERLAKADAAGNASSLRQAVIVPPDYQTWKRAVGLYAFTRIPFASGVRGYQKETEKVFSTPIENLEVKGKLVRYGAALVASLATELPTHAEPLRTPEELSRLLERHAPVFEVDEAGDFDRIGALVWGPKGHLTTDPNAPTVYHLAAYTRYQDRVLLQLVYGVWFSARPKSGTFDLLGGNLDGVMWRVTLDEENRPLLFDSIHPCGCYHQFFPTPRARLKPKPDTLDEYAFVPQTLPGIKDGERIAIRIASRTHYLQRISVVAERAPVEKSYVFASYDDLRSLPMGENRRSAFRPDGMVAGSERGERFLFWPMGVPNAGAMRQYGRHATAFVGRRHFDDPDLIERYFVLGEE
ncbi:MAG: hypothetical protein ACKVQA_18315 [Burkholderiales bacterium]